MEWKWYFLGGGTSRWAELQGVSGRRPWSLPRHQEMFWIRGETSVNSGPQLKTLQRNLAPFFFGMRSGLDLAQGRGRPCHAQSTIGTVGGATGLRVSRKTIFLYEIILKSHISDFEFRMLSLNSVKWLWSLSFLSQNSDFDLRILTLISECWFKSQSSDFNFRILSLNSAKWLLGLSFFFPRILTLISELWTKSQNSDSDLRILT